MLRNANKSLINSSEKGFTLIELMVVIAIIAILAVIGFTIFSGTQSGARDARRKEELNSIAKALEQNYDSNTGQYAVLAPTNFTNGIPTDPKTGQSTCQGNTCMYCVLNAKGNCASGSTVVSTSAPAAGPSFIVCTNLETGTPTFYCVSNSR